MDQTSAEVDASRKEQEGKTENQTNERRGSSQWVDREEPLNVNDVNKLTQTYIHTYMFSTLSVADLMYNIYW
jgi:hypothetical protein